ncbi:MAG: hypothetical protein ACTXOO_03555 [Sodalis sp. (in: enterobacteria)]
MIINHGKILLHIRRFQDLTVRWRFVYLCDIAIGIVAVYRKHAPLSA